MKLQKLYLGKELDTTKNIGKTTTRLFDKDGDKVRNRNDQQYLRR